MQLNDLICFIPELVLMFLIVLFLMVSILLSKLPNEGNFTYNLPLFSLKFSFATLIITLFLYFFQPTYTYSLFYNQLVSNPFILVCKVFILLLSIVYIMMMQSILPKFKEITYEIYVLILSAVLSCLLILAANDFLSLYICFELQSFSLYTLAASSKTSEESKEAGIKYFIQGTLVSAFFLFGVSLVYGVFGTVNFTELSFLMDSTLLLTYPILNFAIVFIFMSILFKLTIVPFNAWSIEAYEGMPFYITIFVSILPKFVIYIIFLRLAFLFSDLLEAFPLLMDILNFSSILIGGLGGLFETEIMRIISFSSTANLGFLFSVIQTPELSNIVPALVFLVSYLFLLINLFSLTYSLDYNLIGEEEEISENNSYISNIHDFTFFKGTHPFYAVLLSFSVYHLPVFSFCWFLFEIFFALVFNRKLFNIICFYYAFVNNYFSRFLFNINYKYFVPG